MSEFLEAAFTLPTAIWSVLVLLAAVYWLIFLLGIFDLDILEGLFGSVEGAAEGGLEGALEGADALEGDAGENGGCLSVVGLSGVPLAISGTLLAIFGWTFSYFGMELLAELPELAARGALVAAGVGLAAGGLSLGMTALAVRPMRKLFKLAPVTGRRDLVGRRCKVTTLRVDEGFGQAEVDDGGATILIQARCRRANQLGRGDRAVIYEYDAAREVFWVVPMNKSLSDAYDITG